MLNSASSHSNPVTHRVVIVGGGTAGWLTACVLAAEFETPSALSITVVESPDTPTIGVGEGTWPSMRSTLKKIGISEAEFLRRCQATLKQGTYFRGWQRGGDESYYHPFSPPAGYEDLNLGTYWSGSYDGPASFAQLVTPQWSICETNTSPKQLGTPEYAYVLNYGYHLDAGAFAELLKERATKGLGVVHESAHVVAISNDDDGFIESLTATDGRQIPGDLFIDCSGLAARLLGEHLDVGFTSVSSVLCNDRALAVQVPRENSDESIASTTWSSAQRAGWVWDIGLQSRRGTGYVFASQYETEAGAEATLDSYLKANGQSAGLEGLQPRLLSFDPGFREQFWCKNCVAIGLSAGFVEPLEASALVMTELSARSLADRFPVDRHAMTAIARRFNTEFRYRWEQVIEFLKLHYVLSQRDDSDYWTAHRQAATLPVGLQEKLVLWQAQLPWHADDTHTNELFPSASYLYVLLGMGFRPTQSVPRRRNRDKDRQSIEQLLMGVTQQTQQLSRHLPGNRELLDALKTRDFAAL